MLRAHTFTTALLTACFFILVAATGLGFLFMFSAMLPLLISSMSKSTEDTAASAALSCAIVALFGGMQILIIYAALFAIPVCLFGWQVRKQYRLTEQIYIWRPVGLTIVDLTLYACVIMAIVVAYYAMNSEGIATILQHKIEAVFAGLPAEYAPMAKDFSTKLNFLVFSSLAWIWVLGIYLHAWIANRILEKQKKLQRASLYVDVFPMPDGLLYLLAVAALASMIGSESMQFLGKASFVALLLPYLFLGLSMLHKHSKTWPGRGFLLFLLYILLPFQFWLSMFFAAFGIVLHIKQINKRLSSGPNSPK